MNMENETTPAKTLIDQAKELEGDKELNSPMQPKPKAKKGRPPKIKAVHEDKSSNEIKKETTINIPTKVLCYPVLKVVSVGAVNFVGDKRAALSSDEAEQLASALGVVLDKYMPDAMMKWGPEIALGMGLTQYGVRLYALKKVIQDENIQKAKLEIEKNQSNMPARDESSVNFDGLNSANSLI